MALASLGEMFVIYNRGGGWTLIDRVLLLNSLEIDGGGRVGRGYEAVVNVRFF